jgi:hypothetical protein
MKTSSYQQTPSSQQSTRSSSEFRETVSHEEIARRAHEIWEQEGCPEGREQEHWLQAERQLLGLDSSREREVFDQSGALRRR